MVEELSYAQFRSNSPQAGHSLVINGAKADLEGIAISLPVFIKEIITAQVPEMLRMAEQIFGDNFDHYNSHLEDSNVRSRETVRAMLESSAKVYIALIDFYSLFLSDPRSYSLEKIMAKGTLRELNAGKSKK